MAIQFLPIIKAVAPYIAQIASSTIPAFTSRPEAARADPVMIRQIEELQAAVTQNAQSIQLLAEKMQHAIQGFENAAGETKKRAATYKTILFVSLGLSTAALLACIYLLAR